MNQYEALFESGGFGTVLYDEPMKYHTTFKIGGPVDAMVLPTTEEEILKTVIAVREVGLPLMILGNGSNLLVKDKGIRGVVLKLEKNYSAIDIQNTTIRVQAGALLSTVAKKAIKAELTGMEEVSGIPGAIGGAVTMNAGAYGGEMKDFVTSVRVIDRSNRIVEIPNEDMAFRYRNSRVQDEGLIVLSATLSLKKGDPAEIAEKYDDFTDRRTSKQPLEYASAGSTFKRPEGYFAGKLIDDCGLRGFSYHDAQVSEKHCGFVINRGEATYEDVVTLIRTIQDKVFETYKVTLEPEVRIVGDE